MDYADPTAQLSLEEGEPCQGTATSGARLRVALFSGNYNYTRDGANRALNTLVAHLLAIGAKVRVYSPTTDRPAFEAEGEVISVPSLALPRRSEFRLALGLPADIRTDIRNFQPNIVHLSAPDWLGWSAQRFAKALRVPTVASMHTRFETYLRYYGLGILERAAVALQRRFYKACDRVLAPNEPCRSHLKSMGVPADRILLWGRGVDTQLFSPCKRDLLFRRGLGFADRDTVVLFLGRLVREKGIDCFSRAIDELRGRGHVLRPLIVGDGPELAPMRARLPDTVFLGHLEGAALSRAVASADILLNPSTTEAFGNVNLEAMAAGLLVVSADAPSAAALIKHHRNGFLCAADPICFADQIEGIMRDRFRGAVIRQRAITTARARSWPVTLESVVRTYSSLLDETR
jgi:glycosyltransferase involved in cell wall biosynthesis